MTLAEAFDTIDRWRKEGAPAGAYSRRVGCVVIDTGGIQMGLTSCPVCGATTGMGHITLSHDDGRRVSIDLPLFHYAEAGHPITPEQLDRELLFSIIADVDVALRVDPDREMTLPAAMAYLQHIQKDGERVGPFVLRIGQIMVGDHALKEGYQYCIHCGTQLPKGKLTVVHEDFRMVTFDISMYHYAEAGHPISAEQLDTPRLLAMLADR